MYKRQKQQVAALYPIMAIHPLERGEASAAMRVSALRLIRRLASDSQVLVDLFVNFNTGFVTADGEVVMCPRRSVKNYLWTWFPIDFVSSISPVLDYFIWWAARGTIVMPGKGLMDCQALPQHVTAGRTAWPWPVS